MYLGLKNGLKAFRRCLKDSGMKLPDDHFPFVLEYTPKFWDVFRITVLENGAATRPLLLRMMPLE